MLTLPDFEKKQIIFAFISDGEKLSFKNDNIIIKDSEGNIEIVADGNGAIMCKVLTDYPEYPTYLIPECIDDSGNPIAR